MDQEQMTDEKIKEYVAAEIEKAIKDKDEELGAYSAAIATLRIMHGKTDLNTCNIIIESGKQGLNNRQLMIYNNLIPEFHH